MRGHFSLIVFLSQGDIEDAKLSPHLEDNGTIKYRDLDPAGKSLVVIELVGDRTRMSPEPRTTWRRGLAGARTKDLSRQQGEARERHETADGPAGVEQSRRS